MARYFFDTSALAKCYHSEPGTATVERLLIQAGREILISRLSVVELHSVLALKTRTREITAEQAEILSERFDGDVADGDFKVVPVTGERFGEAEKLIRRLGATHGLRTPDALPLSVGLDLHRWGFIDQLVASDKVLCKVAIGEGLPVVDPEAAAA